MEFERLVETRQACRKYLTKPVEREKLQKIVETGRLAPSACNSQPWKMYIASGEKARDIAPCMQDLGMNKFLSGVPAFIVVTETDARLKPGAERKVSQNHFVKYDIGELVAYLTLEAKNLGLDTCVIGWVNGETLRKVVGYHENEQCTLVVAVGYSDCETRVKVRKPIEEIAVFLD